jgi:hypothetical protein
LWRQKNFSGILAISRENLSCVRSKSIFGIFNINNTCLSFVGDRGNIYLCFCSAEMSLHPGININEKKEEHRLSLSIKFQHFILYFLLCFKLMLVFEDIQVKNEKYLNLVFLSSSKNLENSIGVDIWTTPALHHFEDGLRKRKTVRHFLLWKYNQNKCDLSLGNFLWHLTILKKIYPTKRSLFYLFYVSVGNVLKTAWKY